VSRVETGAVAVIIVNYGTADLVVRSVESVLARDHGGRQVEVHVVDNASPGDDAAMLEKAHADRGWAARAVTLYLESENHGFGRGNNVVLHQLAARSVPPEFVFLLNSDAWLENETLDILARVLEADPSAAGAGAGILGEDGEPAVCAFRFPSMTSEVVRTLGIGPVERLFRHARVALPPDHDGPVDWVAGASVMFRFDAIAEVGFFHPAYFLYFEEVDLMRQMRLRGRRMLYVRDSRVTHLAGVSTQVNSGSKSAARRPRYVYDSWRFYFHRQHGRAYALVTAVLVGGAALTNRAVATLRRKPAGLPAYFLADHWKYVILPLAGGQVNRGGHGS